ncbi:Rieske (2Fe-2S) protein [Puia sp. P3]|uniref:Rieske (2Fe-2S) protein n=1 Tax=Puia sp. P3 TaxID=3423952 RepID=UPI003D6672FB
MGSKKYKWHKVADAATDLQWTPGDIAEVEVEGKKLCIARANDEWFGLAHVCPHAGAPMLDAYVSGGVRSFARYTT